VLPVFCVDSGYRLFSIPKKDSRFWENGRDMAFVFGQFGLVLPGMANNLLGMDVAGQVTC